MDSKTDSPNASSTKGRFVGPGLRLRALRNRIIATPAFRRRAATIPFVRHIAARRASDLFDLTAGFAYTQATLAFVVSGIGDVLRTSPTTLDALAGELPDLSADTIERILDAAEGIGLIVRRGEVVALDDLGVALMHEPGVLAMVRHHRDVYADLTDPLALFASSEPTRTSAFWQYAGGRADGGTDPEGAAAYSALMAVTQGFVADELIAAYRFGCHRHLIDVGGGSGAFAAKVALATPELAVTVFDLPDVVPLATERFERDGLTGRAGVVGGSFHDAPLPSDGDVYSLVRVLYDHDDEPAMTLLSDLRAAMPSGATLLVGEPMASLPGARKVGTYFTMYLAAMRSGRCRTPERIIAMLREAGFTKARRRPVRAPLFTGLVSARKA